MAGWCAHDSLMCTGHCAAFPKKGTTLFRHSSPIGDTSHSSHLFACNRTLSVCLRPERIHNSSVGFFDAATNLLECSTGMTRSSLPWMKKHGRALLLPTAMSASKAPGPRCDRSRSAAVLFMSLSRSSFRLRQAFACHEFAR